MNAISTASLEANDDESALASKLTAAVLDIRSDAQGEGVG